MGKLLKADNLFILVILLCAAFLRLYQIDGYMTFLGDEGRDVLVAYNILHGHLTLLGPTASVGGFFLGPIYYYFMAPFLLLFNYNPVGPAVMVALFGIATVLLVYKIGEEFFNKTAGFIAAGLYAISPLVIAYSRSSWNPNLMPFFTLATLYTLYKAILKNSWKLFVISGVLLGVTMQLHYLAVFVGVIMALYVIFGFTNNKRQAFLNILSRYGQILLGFVLGWSPFLAFETRHGFQNIKSILTFVFNPQGKDAVSTHGGFFETISNVFFRVFGRLVTNYPPPEQVSTQAHSNIFIWFSLTFLLGVISFGVLLYQIGKIKDQNKKLQLCLILFWFALGITLFGFYRKNIYDYYFEFMFPLPFLLVGNAFSFLFEKNRIVQSVSLISLVGIVAVNLNGIPFKSTPNRQLAQAKEISQFVLGKTDNKPFNFALLTLGNSDYAYRYFFTIWHREPVVIENPQNDPQRKTVTGQLLIVCEDSNCQPLGNPLWEVAGFGRAKIKGEWNVSVVKVYKLVHYTGR